MFRNQPITRKLLAVILLTSGAVLTLTCGTFFIYELVTFRQSMVRSLTTLAQAIAANSTASLAFQNADDARTVLSALAADPHVVAAALYDGNGMMFASYVNPASKESPLPMRPGEDGYRFGWASLALHQPVVIENRRLGTLYLQSDLGAMYQRFTLYGLMVVGVVMTSALLAYVLAMRLQRQFTQPVLALADTAQTVSQRRDYSARAERFDDDELGQLTDAFNGMLAQIQEHDQAMRAQDAALRREVDDRKAAEERFRLIVETALDAVVTMNAAGTITGWSPQATAVFGWSQEEAIGRSLADTIIPERYRDAHRRGLEKYLATGQGPALNKRLEFAALDRHGNEFPIELAITVLRSGDTPSFSAFVRNITERKRMDDDLRRSNSDLEQFAYIASHDLQEPLRMVASYTDLLDQRYRGQLDEKADKFIHYIVDGARRMQRLVADLLTYSRVGSQGSQMTPVNAEAVVKSVLSSLGPLIRETGATVEVAGRLPTVMADETQLMQLLQNLIGNAIKFRSDRPPRVVLSAVECDNRWQFAVEDNGIGIDARFAERIFQMFQRLHDKERYEGSGIGLAIAKRIVERHGGRIWLESTEGSGTTFFFTLSSVREGRPSHSALT
jgi:PAS domain S-box-containing protein